MQFVKLAGAIAGLCAATAAHAGFVYSDAVAPARATLSLPANNQFQSQLLALGATSESAGASISLTAGGSVAIDYFGKEASFVNSFLWNGVTLRTTSAAPLVEPFEARSLGTFAVASGGVLNFAFCTTAVAEGNCVTNAQSDALSIGAVRGITSFISADGDTAWLLWDDGGAGPDDNHDDMVVRLRYSVPEPTTLGLLGLGLLGAGIARRRQA